MTDIETIGISLVLDNGVAEAMRRMRQDFVTLERGTVSQAQRMESIARAHLPAYHQPRQATPASPWAPSSAAPKPPVDAARPSAEPPPMPFSSTPRTEANRHPAHEPRPQRQTLPEPRPHTVLPVAIGAPQPITVDLSHVASAKTQADQPASRLPPLPVQPPAPAASPRPAHMPAPDQASAPPLRPTAPARPTALAGLQLPQPVPSTPAAPLQPPQKVLRQPAELPVPAQPAPARQDFSPPAAGRQPARPSIAPASFTTFPLTSRLPREAADRRLSAKAVPALPPAPASVPKEPAANAAPRVPNFPSPPLPLPPDPLLGSLASGGAPPKPDSPTLVVAGQPPPLPPSSPGTARPPVQATTPVEGRKTPASPPEDLADSTSNDSAPVLYGDLLVDGRSLASWISSTIAQRASHPPRASRRFNTRMAPAWPGMPL